MTGPFIGSVWWGFPRVHHFDGDGLALVKGTWVTAHIVTRSPSGTGHCRRMMLLRPRVMSLLMRVMIIRSHVAAIARETSHVRKPVSKASRGSLTRRPHETTRWIGPIETSGTGLEQSTLLVMCNCGKDWENSILNNSGFGGIYLFRSLGESLVMCHLCNKECKKFWVENSQ